MGTTKLAEVWTESKPMGVKSRAIPMAELLGWNRNPKLLGYRI
jgi:hypothetical protein